jgi:chromosome segregation ATPase
MKNTEFKTPLIQSAAILGGVLVLFGIVASSGASSSESGILTILFGIGNFILFIIGMGIALLFSIALLIAIFLAAVAMVNPEQASQMYSDLKKNFALNVTSLNKQCCANSTTGIDISKEEYDQMKQDMVQLHEKNRILQQDIMDLTDNNAHLQESVDTFNGENKTLKERLEELSAAVEELQNSEKEIKDLVQQLTTKIQAGGDQELKNQIEKLEKLQAETDSEIESLVDRLKTLESGNQQSPLSGIFSYIESDENQTLFIKKIEEALAKEMTYAQIDDYLSANLPAELDKIIKDHPALTKNYIRNLRRD